MTSARFGLQATFVLVLITLVSWPEHRQLRAGAFWHANGPLATVRDMSDLRGRGLGGQRYRIGYGSASEATLGSGAAAVLRRRLLENDVEGRRRPTPAEVLMLGGKLNAIVGYARSSLNSGIPFARLLLRNTITGAVEARGVADEKGRFSFVDVLPSGYIVELLDANGTVIATSDVIAIAVSEVRETIVRVTGRRVFTSFGGGMAPTAQEPVDAAARQGVNRTAAPERCASPPCNSQ